MKELIRLRDLENISSDKPNVAIIMKEVFKYEPKGLFRAIKFRKTYVLALDAINEARGLKVSESHYNESCDIKKPNNIDNISYQAMLNIRRFMANTTQDDIISDVVSNLIAMACYSANFPDIEYDKSTKHFQYFKKRILNNSLIEMFGLYNWIHEALESSNDMWDECFMSVEVDDDYEQEGGARMAQFNVGSTIEALCKAYNLTYWTAWHMSYSTVQTLNYKSASAAFTQEQMSLLKEIKMKASRASSDGGM